MDGPDDLVTALTPFIDLLDRLGVVWYVGGSVASTVHGHFRATNDIDVIADLREEYAAAIREALEADHDLLEQALAEARKPRQVTRVTVATAASLVQDVSSPGAPERRRSPFDASGRPVLQVVLPTGRNFYSVDTRAVPTPAAWRLG